ncbi:hypothetical protein PR202_ga30824 [Eleusine coracana subsp. coracana]|uniref:Uncharacterized protein n=1 Tax=Eleusine coracana subsp. coracana TaxID=191504 RepID=A0AAV5DQT1_ELECO|nr:hypothetical protein PR202_ga30824 [Eleusine coracana subsp. coracana]
MAWIPQDEHLIISSATAAKAPAVMVAAAGSSGGCQLDEREDVATKGVVAGTMSSNGQVPAPKHPLLLAAACNGDWEGLNFLLNREETQASQLFREQLAPYTSGNITNGSCLAMEDEATTSDVEQGSTTPLMSAASLPEGVTVEGYTALHVVAANGDDDNFLKCANLIYGMAANHLSALNNKGDTPLHCATRAGKSQMVSHLIDLASGGRDDTGEDRSVMEFVRKENHQKETALHEAVRIGDNHIVEMLMAVDPELASFPEGYTSPLYLAILLGKYIIAQTLYDKSKGKALSYAGPNGQNALHAAVMRGKVPTNMLLQWNKRLATQSDEKGNTPLHFAAALSSQQWRKGGYHHVCDEVSL